MLHWSLLLMWPIMLWQMLARPTSVTAACWRLMKATMCRWHLCLSAILQSEHDTGPSPSPSASTTATALCIWRATPLMAPGMHAKLLQFRSGLSVWPCRCCSFLKWYYPGCRSEAHLLLRRVRLEDRGRYQLNFFNSFFSGSLNIDLRIYRNQLLLKSFSSHLGSPFSFRPFFYAA